MRKLSTLVCSLITFAGLACASVTASLDGGAPTSLGSGVYRYTYTAVLQSHVFEPGDYFVLYDFYDYVPSSMTSPNGDWMMDDTETLGPYPGMPIQESASAVNLLWVYEGASLSAVNSPLVLGKFSADSRSSVFGRSPFAGITDGGNDDFLNDAPAPIPEPTTSALFGAGLLGIVYARRRYTR